MTKSALFPLYTVSLAQFLTMLIWFNFSAVFPLLQEEWKLTSFQGGIILASFQLGYVVSVFVFGFLSDRIRPKYIFIFASVFAGISGLAFALFAEGFSSALLFRTLAGISLGGVYVPGMKYLTSIYPPESRGKVFGTYVGALVLGSGSSLLVVSQLIAFYSWREVIMLTSIGAFIGAFLMIVSRSRETQTLRSEMPLLKSMKKVLVDKNLNAVHFAYVGHMWELYAFWGWIGPFMIFTAQNSGFSYEEAQRFGNFFAGLFIVVGAFGTWFAGKLSDRWGRFPIVKMLLSTSLICSLLFGWLSALPFAFIVIVGLIYGVTVVGDSPIFSAAASEISDQETVGIVLAVQQVLGYSITVVSPAVFGVVLHSIPNTYVAWGIAFAMLSLGPLMSLFIVQRSFVSSVSKAGKGVLSK